MLEARSLGFTYRGLPTPALRDLDLDTGEGEMVVLAGPSGGGKTTAALGLAGLLGDPVPGDVRGTVTVAGERVLGTGRGSTTGLISLVQQDPDAHLCTLTVLDEVAFGPENLGLPRDEVLSRVATSLAAVGVEHLRHRLTNELSGGEKQRVAIASVLAMEPRLLVLDEPTANLDPPSREEVLSLAIELLRGGERAVVVAEHRLDRIADTASEVVVLADGEVAWRGDPGRLQEEARDVAATGVRVPDRPDLLGIDRVDVEPGAVVLSVEGLVAGYRNEEVLRGVDLEVRAGEMVALVGPNGGGKTTLLRCVLGLASIWEGTVQVTGSDVTGHPTSAIARKAGLVFQTPDHQLFARTVREELAFGPGNLGLLGPEVQSRIDRLSGEYGLSGLLDTHPFRLSLGQKRRLNVASVQASSPPLLMLDEPFIGQDLGSIRALNARIQEARSEGTAINVVSHDLEVLARMVDRAVVLENGRARELPDAGALLEDRFPWGDG